MSNPLVLLLVIVFAGFVSIRKRPSPCVPAPTAFGAIMTVVEPVVQPVVHIPTNTLESS
jgi:hypothetical protein